MNPTRAGWVFLFVAVALVPGRAPAQDLDATFQIAAEMVEAVEAAARRCDARVLAGPDAAVYEEQRGEILEVRRAARGAVQDLRAVLGGQTGPLTIARARGHEAQIFGADLADTAACAVRLRGLLEVYGTYWGPVLRDVVPPDSVPFYERPIDRYRSADLGAALRRNLARIRRFEIKYGPGSARLNAVETLLNYGAQRIWPFKPGARGISPFEVVATYSTSYATLVEGEATAMSAVEFGLRVYNWRYRDTPSSLGQAVVPRYWTVALAVGAGEDGALEWPWQKKPSRLGPAVSWGELKVAYLFARKEDWRLMVSRQFQFLPHVF